MRINRRPIPDSVAVRPIRIAQSVSRDLPLPKIQRPKFIFRGRDYPIALGDQTKIMGIINVTPDSFSADGCLTHPQGFVAQAVKLARELVSQGAHLIDIGGESTRPGALPVSVSEEIHRVIPVIAALKDLSVPISVDTYKPDVAKEALAAGASLVNNIKGVKLNTSLLKAVKHSGAGIVLMHIRGTPRTMQKNIRYHNLIDDIVQSLRKSIEICLEIGIKSDRIIVDPGIGFGKTAEQNLEIINRLEELQVLHQPILVGTSRKSFIGRILNNAVSDRLMGTAATVTASILRGAHIVRVHDVPAIAETVKMTDAIINQKIDVA